MSECTYRETGCGSCENQTNCPYDKMTIEQAIEELKVEYLGDTDRIRKAKDILLKVIEIVFSNMYPEYKEDALVDLLREYREEND